MLDNFINSHLNLKHRIEARHFLSVAVPLVLIVISMIGAFAFLYWYSN